jgi:hypothetical protein
MRRERVLPGVFAASLALSAATHDVHAKGVDQDSPRPPEQLRVLDPVTVVSRLMSEQMSGWNKDCALAQPKHVLHTHEQRIYTRAQNLLYETIIPFLAEYENAVDLNTAYRESGEQKRAEVQRQLESVIPALQQFLRYRRDNPSVVCLLRNQRRY